MADKKLSEVTKVKDMAYVPVILSDGSVGQIAKADLASVVAGQIGYGFKYRGEVTDANSATKAGVYKVNRNGSNVPSEVASVANYIIVEPTDIGYFQTLRPYDNSKNSVYYRHIYGSTFGEWTRIDNFGYNSMAELSAGVASEIEYSSHFIKKTLPSGSEFSLNKQMGFIVLRAGSYSGTINIVYFTAYNLKAMTTISKASWLGDTSESEVQLYKKENSGHIYVKNNTTTSIEFNIFIV